MVLKVNHVFGHCPWCCPAMVSSIFGVGSVSQVKCPAAETLVSSQDQFCAVRLKTLFLAVRLPR